MPGKSEQVPTPIKFRHILVVTYGRSGSTLLQGVLNSIDCVVLRGENGNIFYDLYKSYKKLLELRRKHPRALQPDRPWFGICLFAENELLQRYRELGRTLLLADRDRAGNQLVYGFKEIRYNEVGGEFNDYLDFLRALFPDSAIIFNTRDLDDVAASGWWKKQERSTVIAELTALEARFSNYAADHEGCFSISYEDVVANGDRLRGLYHFLGAAYNADVVSGVLAVPHSYDHGHSRVVNPLKNRP